ncbi:MAG: type 4a pilus biogenesis protein PilO [Thiobacillaceae bacterium]
MTGPLDMQGGRWLSRLGLPGVMGVGVFIASLALYFSVVQAKQQQLEEIRQNTASLSERIARAGKTLRSGERPTAEQLTEFYRIFPDERTSVDVIGKIVAIAHGDGLSLDEGEYRVNPEKIGRLTRMQMILPVKGEYQQIRKFLADMGAAIPVVSLEQVQFQRQKVGDPLVDTNIRLVLYLGHST